MEAGVKRRGRRKKRRKQLFVHKKRRSSASVDNTPAGSPQVTNKQARTVNKALHEATGLKKPHSVLFISIMAIRNVSFFFFYIF